MIRAQAAATVVRESLESVGSDRTRLMDVVIAIQHRLGHVSDESVAALAAGLGMHRVEIEDMVSFYAFFDREPRGRNRIRLSKTPVSFIKGAREVARAFEQALGVSLGKPRPTAPSRSSGRATSAWEIRSLRPWSTACSWPSSHPRTLP